MLLRLAEAIDDLAHADRAGAAAWLRVEERWIWLGVHGLVSSAARRRRASRMARACAKDDGRGDPTGLRKMATKSSHARQQALHAAVQQAVAAVLVGEQLPLHPEQQPVDRQGHQRNEHQHQQDIGAVAAAALADVDDAAQAAHVSRRLDHFGQHDVAEGQAEQQPQRIEDAGHGQRDQHLEHDLPARGAPGCRRCRCSGCSRRRWPWP